MKGTSRGAMTTTLSLDHALNCDAKMDGRDCPPFYESHCQVKRRLVYWFVKSPSSIRAGRRWPVAQVGGCEWSIRRPHLRSSRSGVRPPRVGSSASYRHGITNCCRRSLVVVRLLLLSVSCRRRSLGWFSVCLVSCLPGPSAVFPFQGVFGFRLLSCCLRLVGERGDYAASGRSWWYSHLTQRLATAAAVTLPGLPRERSDRPSVDQRGSKRISR